MSTKIEIFHNMLGKVVTKITATPPGRDNATDIFVEFLSVDGIKYQLEHYQECCETVWLEDVCGDINDLVDTPLLQAESVTQYQDPTDLYEDERETCWTFYKFATVKGSVTFRFCGTSNGYYSTEVELTVKKG